MEAKRLVVLTLILVATATAIAATPQIVHRGCTKPGCVCTIPDHDYQYKSRSRSETALSQTAFLLRKSTTVVDAAVSQPAFRTEVSEQNVETQDRDERNRVIVRRKSQETVNSTTPFATEQQRNASDRLELLPPPNSTQAPVQIDDRSSFTDSIIATLPVSRESKRTVINLFQLDRDKLQIQQCEISQVALQLHDNGDWVLSLRADQNRRPNKGEKWPYNPRLYIKRNQFVIRLRSLGAVETKPAANAPAAGKPILVELTPPEFWVENGQPRYVRKAGSERLVKDYFHEIDRVEIEFFYR